jgi:hypothetical protein
MKKRVNDLILQPLPDGVDLIVSLAVIRDDTETLRAVNDIIDQWYESDVSVILTFRMPGSTAVNGWNLAYGAVADVTDWFVLGADDVIWANDWLKTAVDMMSLASWAQVIGLYDGHTDINKYGPHYMASAAFCRDVLGGHLVPPVYESWWFDREVCETAKAMGVYLPGWPIIAEHTHPDWKTAEMDATYQEAWPLHEADRLTYERRRFMRANR